MASSSPIRVALIGPGGIAGEHVKGYIEHAAKIRCVALCDINPDAIANRTKQLSAANLPAPRAFADWKVMLREMATEIDAVDICLPHHLHGPAILDAAAAGKHILCEKPMCISLAQADDIAAAVKKSGVTYMSGHNQLFMKSVQEAKRMIDAGEIGRVRFLRSQDCFPANRARKDWSWRADLATQGGGELIDTGYHPTYRLLHLAGSPVVEVRGSMSRFVEPLDGEDTASVSVRFANGAIGEVLTSWAFSNPFGTHQIHVVGEKGQIFGSGDTLYFLPNGYTEPAKRNFPGVATFNAEIGHFADCVINKTRPIHSVEEGRAVLEVILKAAESAQGWQKTAPSASHK